jgi:hypothetical protein
MQLQTRAVACSLLASAPAMPVPYAASVLLLTTSVLCAACQSSQMVSAVCGARAVASVMSAASAFVVAYQRLRRRFQQCPPSQ